MAVNTSALRKFQDVWGPVLEAIPAVLDSVEKQADLDRALQAKRLELDKAQKDIEDAYAEADRRLVELNGTLQATLDKQQAVEKEIAAARYAAVAAAAEAEKVKENALANLQDRINATQAQLQGLQGEYAAKKEAAEAEHQEAMKTMLAEIKALETRKASVEKSLETLKAKLG